MALCEILWKNNKDTKKQIGDLDPLLLKKLLERYSKESKIIKWDVGASSSKDLSVQVQQGEAKQLNGSPMHIKPPSLIIS